MIVFLYTRRRRVYRLHQQRNLFTITCCIARILLGSMSTTSLLHIINGPCIGIPQTAGITSERLSNSTTTITNTTHLNGSLNVINNINYYGPLPGPWQLIAGPPCVASVTNNDHATAMQMVGQGGHGILLTSGASQDGINSSITKPNTGQFSDSVKEEESDVQSPCCQAKRSLKSPAQDDNATEILKKKRLNPTRRADANDIYHSSSLSTLKLGGSLSQLWAAAAASQTQLAGKAGLKSVE